MCTQVYDLSKPTPSAKVFAFYRDYIKKAKGPILEPMCGSGRFLIPFMEEGFEVHGFDTSQYMLDALQHKARDKGLSPIMWNGSIQDLMRSELYGLMFIPAGSFGLIVEPEEIQRSLQKMYDHLQSGGTLLFEVETSRAVPDPQGVWRGSICELQNHQKIIANYCSTITNQVCTAIARYELIESGQIVQTEIEEYKVKLYDDTTELLDLLHKSGFEQINIFKVFDRAQKPGIDDAVIMLECVK